MAAAMGSGICWMIDAATGCAQRLAMAAVKRFEDLIVWQLAVAVRDAVHVAQDG